MRERGSYRYASFEVDPRNKFKLIGNISKLARIASVGYLVYIRRLAAKSGPWVLPPGQVKVTFHAKFIACS